MFLSRREPYRVKLCTLSAINRVYSFRYSRDGSPRERKSKPGEHFRCRNSVVSIPAWMDSAWGRFGVDFAGHLVTALFRECHCHRWQAWAALKIRQQSASPALDLQRSFSRISSSWTWAGGGGRIGKLRSLLEKSMIGVTAPSVGGKQTFATCFFCRGGLSVYHEEQALLSGGS
jgi:hypothetical protein